MKNKFFVMLVSIIAVISLCAFAFCACNDNGQNNQLRFVMPDGTPALAAATFLGQNVKLNIGDTTYSINGEIVAATAVQTEIGGEKADILIAPTNLGASLIKQGAPYKLVAVAVEGSLYIIGSPDSVGGRSEITFEDLKGKKIASIGQNNTPDKVFRYLVENTEGVDYSDFDIEFVADGAAAKVAMTRDNDPCDFALVGEPAATALGTPNGGGYSARMDLQQLWLDNGNAYNFPQASLFVKTKYANDENFVNGLLEKLENNIDWIKTNAADVAQYMKDKGSATAFPAQSIPRCGITVLRPDNDNVKNIISQYLYLMTGTEDWSVLF